MPDFNEMAAGTVQTIIDRTEPPRRQKNLAAAALGRLGGLKGGKARAAALTPERRREIAQKAARKRWKPPADRLADLDATRPKVD